MSNSSSANKRVASKIQELSADLFYRKVRDEADVADPKISSSNENFVNKINIIDEKNLADNKNLSSEILLTNENFMNTNFLPEINPSPAEPFANEKDLVSEEFIAKNNLPTINLLPAQLSRDEPYNTAENQIITDFSFASETKFADNKNLSELVIKDSSSILNITTTTETQEISCESKIIPTNEKEKTRRNVPVKNYDSTLIKLAASIGMPSLGILLTLRSILPSSGGNIRVNAFARSIDMSANNVRIQLENLQNKGLIVTTTGGEEGKWVSFTNDSLNSVTNLFMADIKNIASEENFSIEVNIPNKEKNIGFNKFTFPLRSKEFYFACLKVGKPPENFQPAVVRKWIGVAEKESSEYAVAVVLEFIPNAKTNPSAYLHTMLEHEVKPSQANMEVARQLLESISSMNKTIGEEILPKDWIQAAGKLGLRIKMGDIKELTIQQTAIMAKFEKFTDQLS